MRSFSLKFLLFTFLLTLGHGSRQQQQSIGIRGRLMCGPEPLRETRVELWGSGTADKVAQNKTDSNGNFMLHGGVSRQMNVRFKIYHDCDADVGNRVCLRIVVIGMPQAYVTLSEHVQKWFEAGAMNMQFQFQFADERRDCIN